MGFCFPSIAYIFISIYVYYLAYKFKFSWKLKLIALIPLFYAVFLHYVCNKSKFIGWMLMPIPFIISKKIAGKLIKKT